MLTYTQVYVYIYILFFFSPYLPMDDMEAREDSMSQLPNDSVVLSSLSNRSRHHCFPFSVFLFLLIVFFISTYIWFCFKVPRMTTRFARYLFRRAKRRFVKSNFHFNPWLSLLGFHIFCIGNKQNSKLTTNMDSYQYTPSDNEIQQLLYS